MSVSSGQASVDTLLGSTILGHVLLGLAIVSTRLDASGATVGPTESVYEQQLSRGESLAADAERTEPESPDAPRRYLETMAALRRAYGSLPEAEKLGARGSYIAEWCAELITGPRLADTLAQSRATHAQAWAEVAYAALDLQVVHRERLEANGVSETNDVDGRIDQLRNLAEQLDTAAAQRDPKALLEAEQELEAHPTPSLVNGGDAGAEAGNDPLRRESPARSRALPLSLIIGGGLAVAAGGALLGGGFRVKNAKDQAEAERNANGTADDPAFRDYLVTETTKHNALFGSGAVAATLGVTALVVGIVVLSRRSRVSAQVRPGGLTFLGRF